MSRSKSPNSRSHKDHRIQDRTARLRLEQRHHPYWRAVTKGFHLGYYRGPQKSSWLARLRCVERAQGYLTEPIGDADDLAPADGDNILNFRQALDKALEWRKRIERGGEAVAASSAITVREAIQTYIEKRDTRRASQAGRPIRSDAHHKLKAHVLADKHLSSIQLSELTEAHLIAWQGKLGAQAPATRQRIANDFKAALNAAYATHRRALPRDLPIVIKFGLKVEGGETVIAQARENQILSDDQVRAIVQAAMSIDEDFGRLVALMGATGARFAQLRRMCVGDVQAGQCRVMIPQSFKGKRSKSEYIRVAVGSDLLTVLKTILDGRRSADPLLERWRLKQVSAMKWVRVDRGPWKSPSEMTRNWNKAIEMAGLPSATIPYALRHSSIVRGLRAGLPIRLVAALHDTSVAMIERHYARWITEGLEEMVARAVVPLFGS